MAAILGNNSRVIEELLRSIDMASGRLDQKKQDEVAKTVASSLENFLYNKNGGALRALDNATSLGLSGGRSNTKDSVKEAMKDYKKGKVGQYVRGAFNSIGDLTQAAGDVAGFTDSLLGDAILATLHMTDSPGVVNPLVAAGAPFAAGKKARGYAEQKGSEAINKVIHNITGIGDTNREREREAELLMREHPNAGFYHRENMLDKLK